MSHHYHRQRDLAAERKALLIRVMSAMIGLTFGFAGGIFLATPLRLTPAAATPLAAQGDKRLPASGAPLAERILATGVMDENGLEGVLAAIQDDWVHASLRPETATLARLRLRLLFSRWTDLNGGHAFQTSLKLTDAGFANLALEALMMEWGLRDPLAASQATTFIPWQAVQQRSLATMIRAAVLRSPAEALGLSAKINLVPQLFLRRAAGAVWVRKDASHALRFLLDEPGMTGTIPAGAALGQWLLEDPAAFMSWKKGDLGVSRTIPLLRFPADTVTPGRLARLDEELRTEDKTREAGLAWLRSAGTAGVEEVIAALAPALPAAEAEMKAWQAGAAGPPPVSTTEGWLAWQAHGRVLATITDWPDSAAAMAWLATLPPAEEPERLVPALVRQWIAAAPESASTKLFSGDLSSPVAKAAASEAVGSMVYSDPLKALDRIGSLPLSPETAEAFRSTALRKLSSGNPTAMLDWLGKHAEVKAPGEDLSRALLSLAATDAPRAIAWVRSHAPAAESAGFIAKIFGLWVEEDRTEALNFLQSLPAGEAKDQVITQLLDSDLAVTDPFFAGNMLPDTFAQALNCSQDAARRAGLRRILARMGQLKLSTETLLKSPSLLPADRDFLLKNP